MNSRLLSIMCGILLLLTTISGCISVTKDNETVSQPDYALIEFSAIAAMTVIVNETEVSDDAVRSAYRALGNVEKMLSCVGEDCPPLDSPLVVEELISSQMPIEYQALTSAGLRLIRSRISAYVDVSLPEYEKSELVRKISLSVVQGMKNAIEPKVLQLK